MIQFKLPCTEPKFLSEEWHFDTEIAVPPEGAIGFVYCIHNLTNGMKYIGKKLCRFTRTKQVTVTLKNGTKKKKKQKVYTESDWKEYYGSNDYLKEDVEKLGKESFHREVLEWCYSTGEMTYIECWYQMHFNVLLYPDHFYNRWVMARASGTHVKRLREITGGNIERTREIAD